MWRYHPALDGLRALAVTAVLLFHAGVPGVGGGFLGVDAFFVLSGFLITSLLLDEHRRTGRIDLGRFWRHRVRRLLPALLAMLAATVVAGRYLLDPDALGLLRTDAWAALGYAANWRMIFRGTGYVAVTATPSPLQHTWSLAIEEQFYLLWPLLVAGVLVGLATRTARRLLLAGCAAGIIVSALLCAALFQPAAPGRAYFGTDTRAQALLIGAASAVLLARSGRARYVGGPVPVLAGVAATAGLWHLASEQARWMYHGGLTAAALAAALVVTGVVGDPGSGPARLLALPPLVWLGRISYGVYLWHWPLFTFATTETTGLSRWPLLAVRLAGALALAVVSYHLIELPVRRGLLARTLPRHGPAAVTAAAAAAVLLTIGLSTLPAGPPPAVAAPVVIPPIPAAPAHRTTGRLPAPTREPRVTFLGDSVSWTIGTYLPPHPGMWTSVRAIQGCGIATLPDILQQGTPHTNYPGCTEWPRRWRQAVIKDSPDVSVILLNRWELMDRRYQGGYQHVGQPGYDGYLTDRLDLAIQAAATRGAAVALLTAAYTHRAERSDGSLYGEDRPDRVDAWNSLLRRVAARHPGRVTVLDLNAVVCPDGRYTATVHGLRVRSDGLHFTPAGVQQVIAPWLLPRLAALAVGGDRGPAGLPGSRPGRQRS
ncbi:Putative O-acetyltransferase [Actinoplanes sp. SE50]|uniref:acyltransferase family protein n=1 Tax=unclassified Actinoplanes TaxID=2626549 RepID=UPI00023EC302|nr:MULTISPECIES: acyltransferase family protein [unclassified Actinoplanes]AEV85834.1 Putative O-acetyltransferase [Actinoplanes sp. SE50/110]ATO84230.1 Putative O-acetyltransferase [Actinoplanes sp. SE50]SLM01640.1 O-acetyltransferase [Actinoplanes sp. SE50/110]